MTDALRDRLQTTLGNTYTLEREIGGGGMSRVFVAEEKAFGRKVVIKVLPPDLAAGVSVERFKREIVMAPRLQHPHIVPVLSAGEVDGLPYYTMPLVKGESLRNRIAREGELPVNETVRILRDVAAALAYAHADGVVHRDIKPDNVMLTGGVAVVTDLGVGKAVDIAATDPVAHRRDTGLTSIGVALGTPAYMSPEQAAADPGVDHRSDIYSLGCVAYEMLTGATPFAARGAAQMLAAHMTEAPDPVGKRRESTPEVLAQLIARCLAKRPADRPQSAHEVMAILENITSTGSTVALESTALSGAGNLQRALTWFFAASFVVVALSYGAMLQFGLPDWVPLGAIIVMSLGLPVILLTAWVQRKGTRAAAHPTHTPGGTAARLSAAESLATRARGHVTWRKTTIGGVAAVGAFVLLIVAYMTSRAMGIGPAASLASAGKVDKNQKVLIAEFTARGTDPTLAMLAAEAVRADLGQSPALVPVAESEISAILTLMGHADSATVNLAMARSIAQREGIRAIVTGDITSLPADAGLVVWLRLLAAESGDELAAFPETIRGATDLIPALGRLSKTLRAKAGESLKSVRATPPLERVTTSSIVALREYVAGQRANRNTREFGKAVEHLRKAVAADSMFAVAWSSLAVNLLNAGRPQAQRDSAHLRAWALRDRTSQNERYRIESAFFMNGPRRNRVDAARVFEEWLLKDTASFLGSTGFNNFVGVLNSRRDFRRSEEIHALARNAGTDTEISQQGRVVALFNQGKIKEAEAAVQYAIRRFGATVAPVSWEVHFLYHRGQLDSINFYLERVRRERTGSARSQAIRALAALAQLRGQLNKAAQLDAEADAMGAQAGIEVSPWTATLDRALYDAVFRIQPARAIALVDSILRARPMSEAPVGIRPHLAVAQVYALAGRPDRAREVMRERERDIADTAILRINLPGEQRAYAEIEAAEGKPLAAVKLWRMADTLPDGPNTACTICLFKDLGRGFRKANMPDSVIYWYEKYLNTSYIARLGQGNDPAHLPLAYMALGEAYESKGDRAKAREYYQKFVNLWEKADPDLQKLVSEIRARIVAETPRKK